MKEFNSSPEDQSPGCWWLWAGARVAPPPVAPHLEKEVLGEQDNACLKGLPSAKPHTQTSGHFGLPESSPRAGLRVWQFSYLSWKALEIYTSMGMSCFPLLRAENSSYPSSKGKPSFYLKAVIKSRLSLLFPRQMMPITNTKGKERDSLMFPVLTADCHKSPSP